MGAIPTHLRLIIASTLRRVTIELLGASLTRTMLRTPDNKGLDPISCLIHASSEGITPVRV